MAILTCLLAVVFTTSVQAAMIQPKVTSYTVPATPFTPSANDVTFAEGQEASRNSIADTLRDSGSLSTVLGAHHQLAQLDADYVDITEPGKYNNDIAYSHSSGLSAAAASAFLDEEVNPIPEEDLGFSNPDCSSCSANERFRTASGKCNNLNRCNWGTPATTFRRILPPTYEGNGQPTSHGEVSSFDAKINTFGSEIVTNERNLTFMVMQWGQWIAHDCSATPIATLFNHEAEPLEVNCCTNPEYYECFAFNSDNFGCHSFPRSAPGVVDRDGVYSYGQREQMNVATATIDGSPIYGSTDATQADLTAPSTGKLNTWDRTYEFPPTDADQYCDGRHNRTTEMNPCFVAGDTRPNIHLGMMLTHTVFLREHNRIIDEIDAILSSRGITWTAEKKFQEARRIIGAYTQVITFEHYLPLILGPSLMTMYGLTSSSRSTYDPSKDPSIFNSFATAAFRFGHSQIYDEFSMANHHTGELKNPIATSQMIFVPDRIYNHPKIVVRRYVLGMVFETTMAVDGNFIEDISEPALFASTDNSLDSRLTVGLDLAAINIQRGRDHGLPKYSEWTTHMNQFDSSSVTHLPNSDFSIYGGAENSDLFVGGLLEEHLAGAEVGKTFGHIIALQMNHLKYGDRYHYNHNNVDAAHAFSDAQVAELKKITLSQIICRNADMEDHSMITENAFLKISGSNPLVRCNADVLSNYPSIEVLISDQLP